MVDLSPGMAGLRLLNGWPANPAGYHNVNAPPARKLNSAFQSIDLRQPVCYICEHIIEAIPS